MGVQLRVFQLRVSVINRRQELTMEFRAKAINDMKVQQIEHKYISDI